MKRALRMTIGMTFFLNLAMGSLALAKAPIWEDSGRERKPAQTDLGIEKYLDLDCHQLINENSKDAFIKFFTKESKYIHPNLCSIVKEDTEIDSDVAQSERETIGLGTFSHLVEAHFNDFVSVKSLSHYQDMECSNLTDESSHDRFIQFFSQALKEDGISLCGNRDQNLNEDDDLAQAAMPIGLGTYSKVVETYYNEFQRQ